MIEKFKENEARKSALIYLSNFEQVKELYEDDKEMAGELAISILEMALTGEISSNNKIIRLMLKNFEVSAEKNKQKYEARERNTKQENAEKYNLYEIAEMLNEGKTQAEIADALGISRQTVNRRLNEMIRVNYPELLCSNGKMSNDVKQCKNNDNDNDNDNDNESDNGNGNVLPNQENEEEEMKGKVVPFKTPIETKTDYSYLEKEILRDGYIVKEDNWIDNIIGGFYAMTQPYQIETLKKKFGYTEKEANYIVRNIL